MLRRRTRFSWLLPAVLCTVVFTAACGQKGDLYLPAPSPSPSPPSEPEQEPDERER